jgi:hypothetical protein
MPFERPLCLAAAIMASTVAGCTTVSVALAPTSVTLATGTPGGVYHPVGSAICQMFDLGGNHQAMPCVAVSSDGSVANIRRIESGDANFGLSQSDVAYAAFHGEGPFAAAGADPKLRVLIALYPEAFTVVARPGTGIRDFQDLRGKRIGLGTSGSATRPTPRRPSSLCRPRSLSRNRSRRAASNCAPRCLWRSFTARPVATPMRTPCWPRWSRASRRPNNSPNSPRRNPCSPR